MSLLLCRPCTASWEGRLTSGVATQACTRVRTCC